MDLSQKSRTGVKKNPRSKIEDWRNFSMPYILLCTFFVAKQVLISTTVPFLESFNPVHALHAVHLVAFAATTVITMLGIIPLVIK